jgi:hypothetical protein
MTNSTKNALRQKCHAFRHIQVDLLHKRNHIHLRVTALGEAGIFEIHRGTQGGFRGVYAHRRLSEADHHILLGRHERGTERTLL